jgi:hypothetical protein
LGEETFQAASLRGVAIERQCTLTRAGQPKIASLLIKAQGEPLRDGTFRKKSETFLRSERKIRSAEGHWIGGDGIAPKTSWIYGQPKTNFVTVLIELLT